MRIHFRKKQSCGYQNYFIENLKQTLAYLHQFGAHIILVQDAPAWNHDSIEYYIRRQTLYNKLKIHSPIEMSFTTTKNTKKVDDLLQKISKDLPYVSYFSIIDRLQLIGLHLPIDNNLLLYKDSNHLNIHGSYLLAKYYNNKIKIPLT